MIKSLKLILGIILIGLLLFGLLFSCSPSFKKNIEINAVDKIGDVAAKRIASNPDAEGSIAAEFINIPIEAREIADGIWQASGVGNAHIITTADGDVLFDTGLATQVPKQIKVLKAAIGEIDLKQIVLSHSHADHTGGTKFWHEDGVDIITHAEFEEEQRYLTELQDYFWSRNRLLFPFIPESPPRIGLIAYGGLTPTIKVENGRPYKFTQGGVKFELMALPGAEGADNLVLWLPDKKILFAGDFFGPLFPQFPNIFTMRGEKIRKPVEYIQSLETIIALDPDLIVPSHREPISQKGFIREGLVKMRDAVTYVHKAVIDGMNAGKTMEQLMEEIALPPELTLTQQHGRVSWAVKSIWEYYATWFHFDKTTELYPVRAETVYGDIAQLAGEGALTERAQSYLEAKSPLKALHLLAIVLESEPDNKAALQAKSEALEQLLVRAKSTHNNAYEIYWLNSQIRQVEGKL